MSDLAEESAVRPPDEIEYPTSKGVDNRRRNTVLGLDLVVRGEDFRFFDPIEREWLPAAVELAERAARAESVERENARLRAELEALRRNQGAA